MDNRLKLNLMLSFNGYFIHIFISACSCHEIFLCVFIALLLDSPKEIN